MLKRAKIALALMMSALIWSVVGCQPAPQPPAAAVQTTGTPAAKPTDNGSPSGEDLAGATTAADAIRTVVKKHNRLFPKGTIVESVTVVSGIATIDFSPEFNNLSNMGDSTESAAQKQLRTTLATIPSIQKMRVTVHSKPFDSQTTDWTTPFPVRPTSDEKDAAANQASRSDGVSNTGMKDR